MKAVDLFGGPGGRDVAAKALGWDVNGIELDKDARATRLEAGQRSQPADHQR